MLKRLLLSKESHSFLMWARLRHGAPRAISLWSQKQGNLVRVPIPIAPDRHVWVRMGTTDVNVVDQVFGTPDERPEYEFNYGNPRFILDAGAHIGLASIYFALKYPDARIVAIEPDRGNWQLAKRNTAPFPNITVLRGALWNREAHLAIANPDDSPWGFRVMEDMTAKYSNPEDCGLPLPGFTVEGLRKHFGAERIDVFKLDIEGSEIEVLPTVDMSRVGILACETHDRERPGCTAALSEAARGWKREAQVGTTIILRAA